MSGAPRRRQRGREELLDAEPTDLPPAGGNGCYGLGVLLMQLWDGIDERVSTVYRVAVRDELYHVRE
jgi:hypothetical protein